MPTAGSPIDGPGSVTMTQSPKSTNAASGTPGGFSYMPSTQARVGSVDGLIELLRDEIDRTLIESGERVIDQIQCRTGGKRRRLPYLALAAGRQHGKASFPYAASTQAGDQGGQA